MGIVRLGELVLRWCHKCNLPILRQKTCSICNQPTKSVQVTPPGDIRPAFEHDLKQIRSVVSHQFGENAGEVLLPPDRIYILNRAPGLDTIDEIITDGTVVGSLYFDIIKGEFKVIMRLEGADIISKYLERGFVVVDDGAAGAIYKGASVLIPGITDSTDGIQKGDEIIILDKSKKVIATGMAKMSTDEIRGQSRGSAIKTRWYGDYQAISRVPVDINWSTAIRANKGEMTSKIEKAKRFINKTVNESKKPIVVSFSGGKDSLATLLLVLEAGFKPELLFIDTGLELPETLEYAQLIASQYNLSLIIERAGDSFWKHLDYFGPPGKDFRWCCKTCKLGPASRLIKRTYPDGVLSFIGQRAYESEPRSRKGPIWQNPWVPGQYAASPIQRWTALHVWLLLFSQNVPINPWYYRGLDRIGCFLCPASNLSELQIMKRNFEPYQKWEEYLTSYATRYKIDDFWRKFGLWRWRKVPKELIKTIQESDKTATPDISSIFEHRMQSDKIQSLKGLESGIEIHTIGNYKFISFGGYEDCKGSISLEGVFNFRFDLHRASKLMNILGKTKFDDQSNSCSIGPDITLFTNGALSILGDNRQKVYSVLKNIFNILIRVKDCVECGVCINRCNTNALVLNDGIDLNVSNCDHCKKCLGPCTVIDFEKDKTSEF